MSYTPTTWTTGDTITPSALNKIEQGIAEGGGGGYDLVIYLDYVNGQNTVLEGSILACEQKVAEGELSVNGILITHNAFSYTPSGANASDIYEVFQLCLWNCPYCTIGFSTIKPTSVAIEGQSTFRCNYISINYDPDDGSIAEIAQAYNFVNV